MRTLEPIDLSLLEALRRAIDADDTGSVADILKTRALDLTAVQFAEREVSRVDATGAKHKDGNEWHALGGRCSWCLAAGGEGTEDKNMMTCAEYARLRDASRCAALFDKAQAAQGRPSPPSYFE